MTRVLFVGDVVGPPGFELLRKALPFIRERERLDLVIANAENAANGSGLTPNQYRRLRQAGVDAVTLGDHVYKKQDIVKVLIDPAEPAVKPANFPPSAPGKDHCVVPAADGTPVLVACVMGRTYMRAVDCPFNAIDRLLAAEGLPRVVVVDVHAEATADKYLMGHHLDGRATAVLGTHTHVPTADEQILPKGTAFQCDVGMTGPYASVIGRRIDRVLPAAVNFVPVQFDVADGDVRVCGAVIECDPATGRAASVGRFTFREADLPAG